MWTGDRENLILFGALPLNNTTRGITVSNVRLNRNTNHFTYCIAKNISIPFILCLYFSFKLWV